MKSLTKTFTVESKDTAARVGSGGLEVLATPTMIAWMENTALELAGKDLSAEDTTVGIGLTVQHTKASKVGEVITCTATEVAVDGRKLSFRIECFDSQGNSIGTADHDRFVVNAEKFMKKVLSVVLVIIILTLTFAMTACNFVQITASFLSDFFKINSAIYY